MAAAERPPPPEPWSTHDGNAPPAGARGERLADLTPAVRLRDRPTRVVPAGVARIPAHGRRRSGIRGVHAELARGAAGSAAARLHAAGEAGGGEGALGFWSSLSQVYPETRGQRCWMHKTGNVLNYFPRSRRIAVAMRWRRRRRACTRYGWPRRAPRPSAPSTTGLSVARAGTRRRPPALARDREELLAFYHFPAAHWTHLRTTNVIESAFATIRHRSSRAKGCVTRQTMLSMIYKMGMSAEQSWRRLLGFRQLGKVIEGVRFNDGIEVTEDSRAAARPTFRTPDLTIARALADQDLGLIVDDEAMAALVEQGYDPVFGARPLKRAIQHALENPLSTALLEGRLAPGQIIAVSHDGGWHAVAR